MKKTMYLTAALITGLSASIVVAEPYTEQVGAGSVDWGTGEVSAEGYGVAPPRYASQPARARIMAIKAARIDAQKSLLETIQGVRIEAKTLVKDMAIESAIVRTTLDGKIKGAVMVGQPVDMGAGAWSVTMAINYRKKVAPSVLAAKAASSPSPTAPIAATAIATSTSGETLSGLVIDASGLALAPAMAPRILNASGEVLYNGSMVEPSKQADMVAYDRSLEDAKKLPRVGDHVLVLKAVKAIDKTDVVISDEDAKKLLDAAGTQQVFRQARVAIVIK